MSKKPKGIKLKSADYLYFSPCGHYLATSKVQGRIILYSLPDCQIVWENKPLKNIDNLAFSSCGQYLSVTAEGGYWCVLNVADGSQVATQRNPRKVQSVFTTMHFLADSNALFVIDSYTELDKLATEPPYWKNVSEITEWHFLEQTLPQVYTLNLSFTNCQVFQNPVSGRYVMQYTPPVPLENDNMTISYALCTWLGRPYNTQMIDIAPPDSVRMPKEVLGEGRWKWINKIRFANDGDMAVLLKPDIVNDENALLITDGENFSQRTFTVLPSSTDFDYRDCSIGKEIVLVAYNKADYHGLMFFNRQDFKLLGEISYPERFGSVAFNPNGIGLAVAARAKSIYYPDFPQTINELAIWLDEIK